MRKIWFITLFPDLIKECLSQGVIGKYFSEGEVEFITLNPSDYCVKGFKGVDSAPYGGSPGMVLRADILFNCLNEGVLRHYTSINDLHVIYPTPRGKQWSNLEAKKLLLEFEQKDIVFICGRYEGVDERFLQKYVTMEFSIGDYVLSGGELAATIMLDTTLRFKESVLGNSLSAKCDSFEGNLLDSPKYTRPRIFQGLKVPDILLSGNHQKIAEYDEQQRHEQTLKFRPDLLKNIGE